MSDLEMEDTDQVETAAEVDRRTFGKLLIAGAGGLALGSIARAETPPTCTTPPLPPPGSAAVHTSSKSIADDRTVDVVVVGAGLSGLIAARELKKAKKSVLIFEARNRIGGRMYGKQTNFRGGYVDLGGQWIGLDQYNMQNLVAELNITPFLSYEEGRSIQSWNNERRGFNGSVSDLLLGGQKPDPKHFPGFPGFPFATCTSDLKDIEYNPKEHDAWQALLDISANVHREDPWNTPGAKDLDDTTFQAFLKTHTAEGSYERWLPTMQARIGGSGGFEPSEVSLLHMAWTQKVGAQAATPEYWLMVGGAGQIPARLAEELGSGVIILRTPVNEIEIRGSEVVVRASTSPDALALPRKWTVKAKAVIVAMPPSLRGNINFLPRLHDHYYDFMMGSPMGSMSKVHAIYDTAFWREQCLSGSAAGNLDTCEFVADSSLPSGSPGILTAFIAGQRNCDLSNYTKKEIRSLVLKDYAHYFGERALHPNQFVYMPWNQEEWTGGAFTTHLGPHIWTNFGAQGWRAPVENKIFWAGTEASDVWPGYFDGAINAGKKAAKDIAEVFHWSLPARAGAA